MVEVSDWSAPLALLPMSKRDKLIGITFGRLRVVREAPGGKQTYWICVCDCGKEKRVRGSHLKAGQTKSCGCLVRDRMKSQTGSKNHKWRGGRRKESHGYIDVWIPHDHPFCEHNRRSIREHKLVMSEKLGRRLRPGETVHHKNGIRHDNRIENLELWASSHPRGQRVSDLVAWAKEILRTYPNE